MSKLMFAGIFLAVAVLTFCKAAPGAAPATPSASTAIDTLTEQYSGRVKRQGGGGCGCCGRKVTRKISEPCHESSGCCGCGGGGGGGCGCCCCRPRCCCCCKPRCCCRRCCTCCRTCCCTRCCTCCRPCCCGCGGGGRKRRSLQTLAIKLAEKKSQEAQELELPQVPAMPQIVPENENAEQSAEQHSHETAES